MQAYSLLICFTLASFFSASMSGCSLARLGSENLATNEEAATSRSLSLSEDSTNMLPRQEHHFAEIPFEEQAKVMTALIQRGDFGEVESVMQEHIQLQTSTRGGFYYPDAVLGVIVSGADVRKTDFLERLNQWAESDSNSTLALLVRSRFFYDAAWGARGGDFITSTPKSAREEYTRLLKLSFQDLERAASIEPDHPLLLLAALEMGCNIGMERDVFESYFDAITAQIPFIPQAYQIKSTYLEPQWHGSEKELLAFVRESSRMAPRGSVIPLIVSQSHRSLSHIYPNSREYYNRSEVWSDIEASFTRIVEDFPQAGLYPAWYAELAYYAYKDDIAQKYIEIALAREPNNPEVKKIQRKISQ